MKYSLTIFLLFLTGYLFPKENVQLEKKPEVIKRFTIDAGLGVGYANALNPIFYDTDFVFGTTFASNICFQFNSSFKAGVSVCLWYEAGQLYHNPKPGENPDNYRQTILAVCDYYPFAGRKFYIHFGIGGGNFFYTPEKPIRLSDGSLSASSVIGTGFSGTLGIGHEIKTGKKTFLVPSLNFIYTSLGELDVFPGKIDNSNPSFVFGFRLSFLFQALIQNKE